MGNVIDGKYTIKEVLRFTKEAFKNRFSYKDRDVIKRIVVKRIRRFSPDRIGEPTILYEVESKSWPNYKPYFDPESGKKYQRKIPHYYDVILQMDRLSLNTVRWRGRLGSAKKWDKQPSQKHVKSIFRKTREKWKKQSLKKGKTKKEQVAWLKQKIVNHKKKAEYLDVGDYNSRVHGINGDFVFRFAHAWWVNGHLYDRTYGYRMECDITNPSKIVAFPKHFISVIEILMRKGILKK